MKRSNFVLVVIIGCALLFIMSMFFEAGFEQDTIKDLLSSTTFLFGIFAAFSITNAHARLNQTNELLAEEDSRLLIIYNYSKLFPAQVQKKIISLIDQYLIDQIDYYKFDFCYSYKSFIVLMDYCLSLNPINKQEEEAYGTISDSLSDSLADRKKIESLVRQKLSSSEWIIILTLLGMIILFMFFMNNGTLLYLSATLLMTSALIFFVIVIRDLDRMYWNEDLWTWQSLEEVFTSMDLMPYFPEVVVHEGRAHPDKGRKIRLAVYPDPYPDMTHKKVKIVEWK